MTEITFFNGNNLPQVRAEMKAALEAVEKKFGIKLSIGKINYSNNEFTAKLTALSGEMVEHVSPSINPKWILGFKQYAFSMGLTDQDLGTEVMYHGEMVKLVGARPRAQEQLVVQIAGSTKCRAMSVEMFKHLTGNK